jgi:hypothetical protein
LEQAGYRRVLIPGNLIKRALAHDDLSRTSYLKIQRKKDSALINKYYLTAKNRFSAVSGIKKLPFEVRRQIYQQADAGLRRGHHSTERLEMPKNPIAFSVFFASSDRDSEAPVTLSICKHDLIKGSRFRPKRYKSRKNRAPLAMLRAILQVPFGWSAKQGGGR